MRLTDFVAERIPVYLIGDRIDEEISNITPTKTHRILDGIYKRLDFIPDDIFEDCIETSRPKRMKHVIEKLNGKGDLASFIEYFFSENREFDENGIDIEVSAEVLNSLIGPDGYTLNNVGGKWKIIGEGIQDSELSVEVHFESIKEQILKEINEAKFMIWVAVAWFTEKELANALFKKLKEGLTVRIITKDDEINKTLPLEKKFDVRRIKTGQNEGILHHKFCIIDLHTVIEGSYNWSRRANKNKETMNILKGREKAEEYSKEFIKLLQHDFVLYIND